MDKVKSTLQKSFIGLIRAYQKWVSPLYPPCCRFHPSCSSYAITAIKLHGIVKGCWLSCKRILKCNPLHSGGYDPVPPQHNRYKN